MKELPVLLLGFNRPDKLEKVIEALRSIRPYKVFLSVDGPRESRAGEAKKVREVQGCVSLLDWGCEIHTSFSANNQGCRLAVSRAIDWFFQAVPEGVILEDDCIPEPEFFEFAERMLKKFRHDPKVMMIGGIPYTEVLEKERQEFGYFYSRIACVHGWASWARAWRLFDPEMKELSSFLKAGRLKEAFSDPKAEKFFLQKFTDAYFGGNSWAYPWAFTLLKEGGYCLRPKVNLVSNIGADNSGTHTGIASVCEIAEGISEDILFREPPLHDYDPRPDESILRRMMEVQMETKPLRYYFFTLLKRALGREIYAGLGSHWHRLLLKLKY